MQTYTINSDQHDLAKIIQNQIKEPIIINNDAGMNYLIMPFTPEKWQDIQVLFYQSLNEIQQMQDEPDTKIKGKMFTDKWLGFMKDAEIPENYKEEYYEFIKEKHK